MSPISSQIMGHRDLPSFSINTTLSSDCDGADPSKSMSWLAAEKIKVLQLPNAMQGQHFVGVTLFDPTCTFLSLAGYWCGEEKVIIGSHLF